MPIETKVTLDFKETIRLALQKEIDKTLDDLIENAKKDLEQRIREKTAHIALAVLDLYSVERIGNEIVIRVINKE